MIAYISGEVQDISDGLVIIEVGGIGYNINIPKFGGFRSINIGDIVKLYTYTCVREDSFTLYGFTERGDLSLFKLLITVSGIGPKVALSILSTLTGDELRVAIINGDHKRISQTPGVGIKSAQRVIIDLKGKIDCSGLETNPKSIADDNKFIHSEEDTSRGEVIEALISLGYSSNEARKAVSSISSDIATNSSALLKEALRQLS